MQLAPLQIHILRLLSEAGEENIPTIVNTILVESTAGSLENLLDQVNEALQELYWRKLIVYAYYSNDVQYRWKILTSKEIQPFLPINNCLSWNQENRSWQWKEKEFGQERVYVLLQEEGRRIINEYLSF
ncbi:hypothetical protein NIES4071_36830 [Calothrix sp. NIES-4071]|nr:hypothetical protein NIES4071_36830 [Calothrix sp. NIES-4071]BAZ58002.1 hypothetical protein NIES4105_36760 [Calothrix sp. NIES-4105]